MSDQVEKSKAIAIEEPPSRRRRTWLRILLWALLFFCIGFAILVLVLWLNRYSLIESQVRKELEKAGIEAEFDIGNIDRSSATLNNIQLSDDEGVVFSADRVALEYRFEQIRVGIVDKITLSKPELRLTLDAGGNVIDGWVPEGSTSSEPIQFPKDGIHITGGMVNWASPWGAGETGINAQIHSEKNWQSQIDMQSARFAKENVEFDYSFQGNIDRRSEHELAIKGEVALPSARLRETLMGPMTSDLDLTLSTNTENEIIDIDGNVDVDLNGGVFPSFAIGYTDVDLSINAQFNGESERLDRLFVNWRFDGDSLSLTDPEMRKRLVRRTMSYDKLASTPIAMHFAETFERNGKQFLEAFSAKGSGTYSYDTSGYEVEFNTPMLLKSEGQKIVLTANDKPEIKFLSDPQKIELDMDVDWANSRDIKLKELKLTGTSENGLLLKAVNQVSAQIKSKNTWQRIIKGETFRLAPLDIDLEYRNSGRGGRIVLRGDVDYDGALPGGRASGLRTGGEIVVKTNGSNFAMSYRPTDTIKIAEFISTTGWRGENISFDLVDGEDVLTRSVSAQPFEASLTDVKADVASPEDDRHLQAQFDTLQIGSNFKTEPRIWDLDFQGIKIASDDFPSPGTRVESVAGTAKATQYNDGTLKFLITSPKTEISTDNVQVTDLFIEMNGQPQNFSANYKAGSVQLLGGEIPEVPMEGTARLQNGVLSGAAVAPMPRTKETPINITYRSEEGVGGMQISIPKVVFTPRGLQPQYLIPALRGKLAEVSGEASAEFEFVFGDGGPVRSFGTTTLNNMDIGTLVGPASGVSSELTFKSMFPLETDGVQTATLTGFDAGIPLENGTIRFELVADGVRIDEAEWPVLGEELGDGKVYISPMLWRFGNVKNEAVVNVDNISLGNILARVGNGSLSGTGQISGRLPATVKGVDVIIHDGRLAIEDGGVIRYRNQGIDTFAKDAKPPAFLGEAFAGSETGFAFKALENFEYKELEALIDGPLDGEMTLRMLFGGKNPELLSGTAFEFDVAVSGELGNIARDSVGAFDAQKHLDAIIDMQREESETP